jgi:hypothetical protein
MSIHANVVRRIGEDKICLVGSKKPPIGLGMPGITAKQAMRT